MSGKNTPEYMRAWRASHRDHLRAYERSLRRHRVYTPEQKERRNMLYRRRWAATHGSSKPVAFEELNRALMGNDLYQTANACVPRYYAWADRADIISALMLAVIAGEFEADDMPKHVKRFATHHFVDYRLASLDAVLPGTDGLRLYDVVPAQFQEEPY